MTEEPAPFMPEAEVAHLRKVYSDATVILEYGSGGSTEVAARMPGKYIMSVESDRHWARELRQKLTGPDILSPAVVYHADIGETGPWGRPVDQSAWRRFHDYPNAIWDKPWFRDPDVVLIDGRFRTACFAAVLMRAKKPTRVLFDDYGVRPLYHQIEELLRPVAMIGRMAEFQIEAGLINSLDTSLIIAQFFQGSIRGVTEPDYQLSPREFMTRK